MMHDWSLGSGGMLLGPFGMFLWLVLLIAVVVVVMRYLGAMPNREAGNPSPKEILDARYARGEIDELEYQRRRKALGV